MQIGAVFPQIELGGDAAAARRIGEAVEQLGFDHLLAYDHVLGAMHAERAPRLVGPYTERDPFHDPLVLFSHLAARTSRLGFVSGVLILPQRQTALVARQVADLDLLSGGRFRLGVGVGWNHVEYEALGQDFGTRGAREEEQIGLLRQLWAGEVVEFEGRFHRVDRAALVPAPDRQVPIWLGGFSPAAFARAARLADGFVFTGRTPDVTTAWQRLREMVDAAGRRVEDFGGEAMVLSRQGPGEVAARVHAWREAGGTHASVITMGLGLEGVDAHIEYLAAVAAELDLAA